MSQKFNLKVATLAWDITQQLKKLQVTSQGADTVTASSKATIYLAECSWDRRQAREALAADLRLHGYLILPDHQLPRDEAEYVADVVQMIERSQLSIHLVGTSYGAVPDGPTQKSVVVLQNELAVERSRQAGFRRVIWIADGPASPYQEQQQFVRELETSAEAQYGADLLTGDLETVKAAVHAALRKLETPVRPVSALDSETELGNLIYLICDERDRKTTIPLRKFLKARKLEVQIPVFEGDAATIRSRHQELLAQCGAVIVFYGAGDESWKRAVDSDLRKLAAYRGGKPLLG